MRKHIIVSYILEFPLVIALNLINIRQTVTIKFRVGIKSVSQNWTIMGKLMHDISERKTI